MVKAYILRMLILVFTCILPFYGMANEPNYRLFYSAEDSTLNIDSLGNAYYLDWTDSRDTIKLFQSDSCYTLYYQSLSKNLKYEYAYKMANLFVSNKESSWIVKEWYIRSINAFDYRRSALNKGLSGYEILEEKYALVLEFTGIYSRTYGKCEDAVEVLREYKTEYNFKYIKYNRGLDQTDKIWLKLVKEDQYLSWQCEEK